jgi:hypothetical protein
MTAEVLTAQERIRQMKIRVQAKKKAEELERTRSTRTETDLNIAANHCLRLMQDLEDLPVKPSGKISVGCLDWRAPERAVVVQRVGVDDVVDNLMSFIITVDADANTYTITHDGDEIDDDIMLDLATAAVEAILDA